MAQIIVLKRAHFFGIPNDIIDIHGSVIGADCIAVFVVLSRFVNRKTGECWPSIGTIAKLVDRARNTVKAALRKLEEVGLIAIRRRRDAAGDPTSHQYTLLDPTPQAVEARRRRKVAELAAERGRSTDDRPRSADDPLGRSTDDHKPEVSLEPKEENHGERSDAEEKPPVKQRQDMCSHPEEELSHFGAVTVCQHCWKQFDLQEDMAIEHPEMAEEDRAHAACA